MSTYQIQIMPLEEAKQYIQNYENCLLYYISETVLADTTSVAEIHWEELFEAYFFDVDKQLHFIDNGEGMKAVLFQAGQTPYVEKEYKLNANHKTASKIVVREYLDADEDGQTYVVYTGLAGMK